MFHVKNRISAFLLGALEFRKDCTWADPNRSATEPYTLLDEAYDWGREWAHRLTFRAWEG